ncbi:MAG: 4a-hydroxytetrahydrobiopterin dehydratase [Candidatus Eiseniibacteriota bacterium]
MGDASKGLAGETCTACRPDSPRLTDAEVRELSARVPGWSVAVRDGVPQLTRTFQFGNFEEALAFTSEVGALAESYGHHPAILTEWGKVTVSWWTHAIGGLHRNDFVMAAKTSELAG